jgi:hypothetical protein
MHSFSLLLQAGAEASVQQIRQEWADKRAVLMQQMQDLQQQS